ncbi:MAG: hypothetical protein H0X31_13840 [Nostocaceae cyanobacterium]|nr:hypothetical protein [Nostocaceae cyanobacterium]
MVAFNRVFKLLSRTMLMVVLAGVLLLGSFSATSATAFANNKDLNTPQEETAIKASQGFDEIESGKEAAKVIPKNLGNGDKDTGRRVTRALNELTNDQYQRVFGAEDYKRSQAEQELSRNKAERGDY